MRLAMFAPVLLVLLWFTVARSAEPSLFETYRTLCSDTRADPERVLGALGAGWVDAPMPELPNIVKSFRKTRATSGGGQLILIVTESLLTKNGETPPFDERLRVCMLSRAGATVPIKAAMRVEIGAAPTGQKPTSDSWTYFDEPLGRHMFADISASEWKARLAKAPLVMVMAMEAPLGSSAAFTEVQRVGP
jgi:hypothetical protein